MQKSTRANGFHTSPKVIASMHLATLIFLCLFHFPVVSEFCLSLCTCHSPFFQDPWQLSSPPCNLPWLQKGRCWAAFPPVWLISWSWGSGTLSDLHWYLQHLVDLHTELLNEPVRRRNEMVWERDTYVYFLTPYSPGLSQCPLPYLPHLLVTVAIGMNNSFCPLPPHSHRVRLCPVCQERTLAFSPLGNCPRIHELWLTSSTSLISRLRFPESGQLVPTSFLHNKLVMSSKKKVVFFLPILSLHMHCYKSFKTRTTAKRMQAFSHTVLPPPPRV